MRKIIVLIIICSFLSKSCIQRSDPTSEPDYLSAESQTILFEFPIYRAILIDSFQNGYQVGVTDMNNDGKKDIVGLSTNPSCLVWYENPAWQKHVIHTTTRNNISMAFHDIDQDGWTDIALASDFNLKETSRDGDVSWLKNPGISDSIWILTNIDKVSNSHRLIWMDCNGDGMLELLNAPIVGKGAKAPEYQKPVDIKIYPIPENPYSEIWPYYVVDSSLTVVHGISSVDWNNDGMEDILAASFEGLTLFLSGKDGEGSFWEKSILSRGDQNSKNSKGASEICLGKSGDKKFMATIEPWHGDKVVVYMRSEGQWKRMIIDDHFVSGHSLAVSDLDGDGNDEIIAGYRGSGSSLFAYHFLDGKTPSWRRISIDRGDMASSDVVLEDLNNDGNTDIISVGSTTGNIKIYEALDPCLNNQSWSGDRVFIVVEKGLHQVGFYDADGQHIKSLEVDKHPHEIVLSGDKKFAYVTETGFMRYSESGMGGHAVRIINIEKMEIEGEIPLGRYHRPHGISIDTITGLLAVGVENPPRQLIIDPETRKIIHEFDTEGDIPHMNTLAPGGEWVYVSNTGSATVAAIKIKDEINTLIPVGENPQGSAITSDGKLLFVTCSDRIDIIDTRSLSVTGHINQGALRAAIAKDDLLLVFASRRSGIGFYDIENRKMIKHLTIPFQPYSLTISSDGKYAFAAAEKENICYVISVDNQELVFSFKSKAGARPDPFYDIPAHKVQRKPTVTSH